MPFIRYAAAAITREISIGFLQKISEIPENNYQNLTAEKSQIFYLLTSCIPYPTFCIL